MAYASGTSTGPDDLLSKLKVFLQDEDDWTVNDHSADGTGYRLHVEKNVSSGEGVMFFNFRSATDENGLGITENNRVHADGKVTGIVINGSTGYNGGQDWHNQPGYSLDSGNDSWGNVISPVSVSAIPSYYFFSENNSVHIVVEITSGLFQFISFGTLEKEGDYTGGQFWSGSFETYSPYLRYAGSGNYVGRYFSNCAAGDEKGAVYVDADSLASWRISQGSGTPDIVFPCVGPERANAGYSRYGMCSFFWEKSPNFYNNIPAFCPIYVFLKRDDDNYSLLGEPAGVRFLNMLNYSPADEIVYGGDTWLVFPGDQLGTPPTNENTGFAFKKVV